MGRQSVEYAMGKLRDVHLEEHSMLPAGHRHPRETRRATIQAEKDAKRELDSKVTVLQAAIRGNAARLKVEDIRARKQKARREAQRSALQSVASASSLGARLARMESRRACPPLPPDASSAGQLRWAKEEAFGMRKQRTSRGDDTPERLVIRKSMAGPKPSLSEFQSSFNLGRTSSESLSEDNGSTRSRRESRGGMTNDPTGFAAAESSRRLPPQSPAGGGSVPKGTDARRSSMSSFERWR